jgi:hypothetical protein
MALERGYDPNTDYLWVYGTFIEGVPGFDREDENEEMYSAGIDSRRLGNYLVLYIANFSDL